MGGNSSKNMNNKEYLDNIKYLNIKKIIDITIKTKIKLIKIKDSDQKKIKKYIKNTIEQMGSGSYNYISNYIFIKKINLKIINNKLEIYIDLKIDKNGKKIIDKSSKKLKENKINQLCTKNNLKEHIIWSLNEISYRGDPVKLENYEFILPENKITSIIIS
jgi:hypothetical protein